VAAEDGVAAIDVGRDLSDPAALAAAAVGGGLDAIDVNELLAGDRGAADVRRWEQNGRRLGIAGVPFFIINGKVALSGAQPPEDFRAAIERGAEAGAGRTCEFDPETGERTF
jgi:predicted DsbA family dithiol-disulfide isomerase